MITARKGLERLHLAARSNRRSPECSPFQSKEWRIAFAAVIWSTGIVWAQPAPPFHFVDTGASRGIRANTPAVGMGAGVSAADFDRDGRIDFFVPNGLGTPDQLYRNIGGGQYKEGASQAGLASTENNRCALWFDYDGDGNLDVVVGNDTETAPTTFRLYRQYGYRLFQDVTQEAGLFMPLIVDAGLIVQRTGLCAGDINNDGYLDLYASIWNHFAHLFLNNGDGTFTDISISSGVGVDKQFGHQPMMADFNRDGWLDLYVNIDFGPNRLWINQGNNTFVDVAPGTGADNAMNDMGLTLGDYDNDGDWDIYTTNIFEFEANERNVLLRNDSTGQPASNMVFSEIGRTLGVDYGGWGWGTTFFDADNDGLLDIGVTNGWTTGVWVDDMSLFYWNQGGTFVDASTDVGFDDTFYGSCLIAFDSDRDGDLDLVQVCMDGPLRLLENRPDTADSHNYLTVRPRQDGPNRYAIGAVVRLSVGASEMMRLITAGTSYLGQEPAEAFFGVGSATMIDSVTVEWPGGTQTTVTNVAANQLVTITPAGMRNVSTMDCIQGSAGNVTFSASTWTMGGTPTEETFPNGVALQPDVPECDVAYHEVQPDGWSWQAQIASSSVSVDVTNILPDEALSVAVYVRPGLASYVLAIDVAADSYDLSDGSGVFHTAPWSGYPDNLPTGFQAAGATRTKFAGGSQPSSAIPAVSDWGVWVLFLLVLTGGSVVLLRQRRTERRDRTHRAGRGLLPDETERPQAACPGG